MGKWDTADALANAVEWNRRLDGVTHYGTSPSSPSNMNRNSSAITAPPKRLALPDASSSKRQKTDSSDTHHEQQNPPDAGVSVHASQLDIPRFSINALPRELTAKIHHLAIPPINVLSVENPETLLSSAEPMITLRAYP